MNRAALLAAAVLAALPLRAAQTLAEKYSQRGTLMMESFASAPFPHPDRAQGHRYKDEFFPAARHYQDNTVALFIPKGFRETGEIDCVIHFHGWHNHVANVLERYKLIEQLVASGRNAVLIVPQGPYDAADSFGGKLEDPDGFKRFMDEVLATLRRKANFQLKGYSLSRIILSGHSGGYHVISAILDHGGMTSQIREVWLFDALYGQTEKFDTWVGRGQGRLLNIYTDNGGTKAETEAMMARFGKQNRSFLAAEESSRPALQPAKLIFLHTALAHDEVVEKHQTFRDFLKSSCLEPIEEPR